MAVKLVFLGRLADLAGADERDVPAPLDWQGLLGQIEAPLAEELRKDRTRIAVDGTLLADKAQLNAADGAEVALLPPVSGG